MKTRVHYKKMPSRQPGRFRISALTLRPQAQAIALLLAASGAMPAAHAQQAFSRAWMAQKNMVQDTAAATGRLPNGQPVASLTNPQAQQQRANEQLQRSLDNLNVAARGIAAMQAAQAAARQAAANEASVPDGLAEGGLKVDTNSLTAGWANARKLDKESGQKVVDGRTQVTIQQTADKAILNWETFNVGRNTTVQFDQQPGWAVLNRVNDPQARPSQIQGQIKADGTVMIVNRNGIVFSGTSQVDTRNLVAAAAGMTNAQFDRGLFSESRGAGYVPTFANDLSVTPTAVSSGKATGDVVVEAGARIVTRKPESVTQGGGYVLLLGREAHNRGTITTPGGQTALAAGDSFVIRRGFGTDTNQTSSTRGNEIDVLRLAGSEAGRVSNSGLIQAPTGDITLKGHTVEQTGVLVSTTSVNTRGTIHLRAEGDDKSRVTLAPGSVSAIVLDDSTVTALDVQRDALLRDSGAASEGGYNRRDQSLVQIASAGDVLFDSDSLTLATGGQISVNAVGRTQLANRATLDVAGAVGVNVAMAANNVEINVQGNEQRDAPGNRDSKTLNNTTMWVDRRYLVRVAAGTNGYTTDRWYTGGGLLEVGGYLSTGGHGVGEWAALGGTVLFDGGALVSQAGSSVNVSGGSLNVQTGTIRQSWLRGEDGRLYNLDKAPADVLYKGLYRGYESEHQRWGKAATEQFNSPLIAPDRRLENGYTVGRDAGRMVVGTATAVLEGDIQATVYQAARQSQARDAGLDGYRQSQFAAPLAGALVIGKVVPVYDAASGTMRDSPVAVAARVDIGTVERIAQGLSLADVLPDTLAGHIRLDGEWLNSQKLGALKVYAKDGIAVDAPLTVAHGGTLALHAADVAANADLTARGGTIALGNIVDTYQPNTATWAALPVSATAPARVGVADGVTLDARGVWTNLRTDADGISGLPYVHGGNILISTRGDIDLGKGSVLDVSSGASLQAKGTLVGGRGGNISLLANQNDVDGVGSGTLRMDGELRGYGVRGGGTLKIDSGIGVAIGGGLLAEQGVLKAGESVAIQLTLAQDFTMPAGTVLPVDYTFTSNRVMPGEAAPGKIALSRDNPVTLAGNWVVPPGIGFRSFLVYDNTGRFYVSGQTVPAGTVLTSTLEEMAPGYVVPAGVFANGMPVALFSTTFKAGTPFAKAVALAAGDRLPAGAVFGTDVAVKPLLVQDGKLFQSGFGHYDITGQQGVQVAEGARVDVNMPVLRLDVAAAHATPTGASPDQVLQRYLAPVWEDDPKNGVLAQRRGADLILTGGNVYSHAPAVIGKGGTVSVDPGQGMTVQGNGQITVDGTLNAWGGRISILQTPLGLGQADTPSGKADAKSIWIGNDAVLDAAGRAVTARDSQGRHYGVAANGGTIEIGAPYKVGAREVDAADAFVVVRPGARLDASGASADIDIPGQGSVTLPGNGGVIALSSMRGVFVDGGLRAMGAGAGAAGGTLAIALETPVYLGVDRNTYKGTNIEDAVRVPRELILAQLQGDSLLPDDLTAGARADALAYGRGRIGADRIRAGGFGNVALLANGMLSFEGPVDLSVDQSLRLVASSIGLAANADPATRVTLAAPYVQLAGITRRQVDNSIMPNAVVGSGNPGGVAGTLGVPLVADGTSLAVDAGFLDLTGALLVGTRGQIVVNSGDPLRVERKAFDNIALRSRADMRMSGAAEFYTSGNLTVAASQIYPVSNDSGKVVVGLTSYIDDWGNLSRRPDPTRVLNIERSTDADPSQPYSVFGAISLAGPTINQGGVVRAPLGRVSLGSSENGGETGIVNLLPGSVTSVSAKGLTMPYGGTLDGLSYLYNGKDVAYDLVGTGPTITLAGHAVDVRAGAVLDMSGGGDLAGAAFLGGRGGSTDARMHPLIQVGANGGFTLPGLSTNPVYAIVPGAQAGYAPIIAEKGAGDPAIGRQITVGAGVQGLPPGTYTLLPSTYALLPGAFRVELNGAANPALASLSAQGALAMRNGSHAANVRLSTNDTGIRDALPTQAIITSADTLRRYSQYNETSYAGFAVAAAARAGVPRSMIERDAKTLTLSFLADYSKGAIGNLPALKFNGTTRYDTPAGGLGGSALVLASSGAYEIMGPGGEPRPLEASNRSLVSLYADDLNAIGAARLGIGALPQVLSINNANSQRNNVLGFLGNNAYDIVLRSGAVLKAPEVFLVTNDRSGGIVVEQGAGINTLGQGKVAWDSTHGYVYDPGERSVLAVSNGWIDILAPAPTGSFAPGRIDIGACPAGTICASAAQLYSEGTIAAATDQTFELRDTARYGTRNLSLAVGAINVGSDAALAAAAARGALPPGLRLSQDVLNRLLKGDTSTGAPALANLILTARDAVNFHDSITLSTLDPVTHKSALERLVLTTPAIYGAGDANAEARIETDVLVWNGARNAPGQVATGGAGTGAGKLTIDAREIAFGFAPSVRVDTAHDFERLALGFSEVNLKAGERITANNSGSLTVYQSRGAWDDATHGYTYTGGNLRIDTPLLTGHAGSVNRLRAGGDVVVSAPQGAAAPVLSNEALVAALGAELKLEGRSVTLDSAVALPSGKLSVTAQGDLVLGDRAQLDLAGRKLDFYDVSKYSWGGDVMLESQGGSISQAAGSRINLSALENRAGKLTAIALGEGAGTIDLQGKLVGGSTGRYDAGGTWVPFAAGGADIRGQRIADFAGLNQRLNEGNATGSRSFQIKQGDLTVGDELKAREINVSVDGGRLLVTGTIDASGEQVGSIRLAARDGVSIGGSALLDAHGRVLRKDSYGQVIEAPNRAIVEIDSRNGTLLLADGARMDLRAGTDGTPLALGTVDLGARRIGGARGSDVDIDASGNVRIDGARSVTVNAFQRYDNAPLVRDGTTDGRDYQSITQGYLNGLHDDSVTFMGHVLANGDLMTRRLAGLRQYADAFHLRPGVEIVSAAPGGDLHIDGDIDLSGYRYASVNPHSQMTGVYGSGEAGALVLRAGGNLKIFGSLSDGFDGSVLKTTPDDQGWILVKGRIPWGGDIIVPTDGTVTLADGTFFQSGNTLNYALPMQAMTLRAGTQLATRATLTADLVLPAGTVLGGAVRDGNGNVIYAAGTVLSQALTLASGMQLDAGNRVPSATRVAAMLWPANVPLPFPDGAIKDIGNSWGAVNGVQLAGALALRKGALIPNETLVKLPGDVESVQMRAADADGNQGRNWALAPMLAPGSQSWSIRLVAGADLGAADTRALVPHSANGHVLLADTHYGLAPDTVLKPGTGLQAQIVWTEEGAALLGYEAGALLDLDAWGGEAGAMDMNSWGLGELVRKIADGTPPEYEDRNTPARQQLFSVLRTGTGDLDVLSAGNFTMSSPFGVYTAGTQSVGVDAVYNQARSVGTNGMGSTVLGAKGAFLEPFVNGGTQSLYRAWYPERGGNVLVRAGGDVRGDTIGGGGDSIRIDDALGVMRAHNDTSAVGNWMWRQGTGSVGAPGTGLPTAWWVNFGTYVPVAAGGSAKHSDTPFLVGFTGIGTLGGGNLVFDAGGDVGMLESRMGNASGVLSRSQGLSLAVASTGRVSADGRQLTLTGGGDLDIRIGGGLNPVAEVRSPRDLPEGETQQTRYDNARLNLTGVMTNLRGAMRVATGSLGGIELRYDISDSKESRAYQPYVATSAIAGGGPVLVPGDSGVRVDARGDVAVGGVADPGRATQVHNGTPFTLDGASYAGEGWSWFSLWTPSTAIDLFSAGGNLTPSMAWMDRRDGNHSATDGRFVMPSILRAAAPNGSLYYGGSSSGAKDQVTQKAMQSPVGLMIAPSPVSSHFAVTGTGALELLAGDSIYAGGYSITQSGADPTALPSPFNPGFAGVVGRTWFGGYVASNVSVNGLAPSVMFGAGLGSNQAFPMFSLTSPTASGYARTAQPPARFYANEGDIVGLRTGAIVSRGTISSLGGTLPTWYEGGGPVAIRAGRDIVNAGTELGATELVPEQALGWFGQYYSSNPNAPLRPTRYSTGSVRGNLIVHNSADDISVISAGRDILGSTFYVAGPGLLEITAGRDLYMADKGELKSLGPVVNVRADDRSSGAAIAVAAGVGARGLDGVGFQAFAARYLDPANQADPGRALASQPGKAVTIYGGSLTLTDWLRTEFGYDGDEAGAPAFLAARQADIDRARQQTQSTGTSVANRDLQREYGLNSQLYLVNWLTGRFGGANGLGLHFDATTTDARAFFAALPPEQQRAYLRNVYYAELRASGREYNDIKGPRAGSYLRGREAIATLLPAREGQQGGQPEYDGDLTMFSSAKYYRYLPNTSEMMVTTRPAAGVTYVSRAQWVALGNPAGVHYYDVLDAGIHTDFGGDVSILTPGGRTLVGVDGGFVPGNGSGVLTQGSGEIQMYARDSILLGQSRIFTTFGGNILAWSAQGDINAGRGSKSTVVYTPQRRVYDNIGLVSLSPTTPNTGAGIATLNPVPEVPPGDIDLIAPLGTIDAGEAGIRVSGNVNLAALRVVNAENIQVQGKATGIPVMASVNVGALSNASAVASQAVGAAQEALQRERSAARQGLPSIFTVRVLGFGTDGDEAAPKTRDGARAAPAAYDPNGVVQVLGQMDLSEAQLSQLTATERRNLRR